ncbi:MAG: hypothetical protein M0Z43_09800 [Acidithiobacillus sp.]|nr:hypothetical protein [Acidithiobacillus sp.]
MNERYEKWVIETGNYTVTHANRQEAFEYARQQAIRECAEALDALAMSCYVPLSDGQIPDRIERRVHQKGAAAIRQLI